MAAKRFHGDSDHNAVDRPKEKRMRSLPSFSTVIREAVIAQSMQKFCFALEPLLRKVVKEEVERGLLHGARSLHRSPQILIQEVCTASSLQLIFKKPPSLPIFTGSKIEGEDGNPLEVLLIDTNTGERSRVPSSSPIKVEIVVLDGDFPSDDGEDWTSAEFDRHILKERTGRRPLLAGDFSIALRDGMASINELTLTDNSSWVRSRNFRLGARVSPGSYQGPRIREAIMKPFAVKDHRGELYKKHYPPALGDEIWRLEKIGKDGVFHKKLAAEGIETVEGFLRLWVIDPHRLRRILGAGMSDRMWEGTISHARSCAMGDKLYMFRAPRCTLILSPICEVVRAVIDGLTYTPQELTGPQKAYVHKLVLEASQCWDRLEEVNEIPNGNTILLQDEPANGGFLEVGFFPGNLQVEVSGWIQSPACMYETFSGDLMD